MEVSQDQSQKLKYPRAIPFIILNEFCERFSYYGMRSESAVICVLIKLKFSFSTAILVLYLNRKLMLKEDDATIIYHIFTLLLYFSCIFGLICDSFLGKFKTIIILSITCAIGNFMVTIGAVEPWDISPIGMTAVGLILVAIGSGGIKPCVSTFGGEQFKLPEQAKQLSTYFSLFYFTINAGSLISTIFAPTLHEDVKCFGMEDCFPAGFGLPALLMTISIILFFAGKFLYKVIPSSNMVVKVSKCIGVSKLKLVH
jgi:solute carrier family 15 (oligopeptide transporter), member 1